MQITSHVVDYYFLLVQIYTDWANHYLQKGRSKRHITDLQNDVMDGTVLADVIEAVSEYAYYSSQI